MGIDMVRLVIVRLLRKKNPFDRDLNHFHHLLLRKMNLFQKIFLYLILSFAPIFFSKITNYSVVIFIPLSVIIYFYMINKLSKIND